MNNLTPCRADRNLACNTSVGMARNLSNLHICIHFQETTSAERYDTASSTSLTRAYLEETHLHVRNLREFHQAIDLMKATFIGRSVGPLSQDVGRRSCEMVYLTRPDDRESLVPGGGRWAEPVGDRARSSLAQGQRQR